MLMNNISLLISFDVCYFSVFRIPFLSYFHFNKYLGPFEYCVDKAIIFILDFGIFALLEIGVSI